MGFGALSFMVSKVVFSQVLRGKIWAVGQLLWLLFSL